MNLIFDFSDALRMGMGIAFAPQNIGFCVAGCLVGVLICGLGGLRAIAAMALLLPFAVRLSPASGLVLLVGGYGGAQVMRSAALRRIEPARDGMGIGMAGPLAGFAGVGVMAAAATGILGPMLAVLVFSFDRAELLALMCFGLACAVSGTRGSMAKAAAMAVLGLLVALVGTDRDSGVERLTMGSVAFADGLDFAVVAMGLLGAAEIIRTLGAERKAQASVRWGVPYLAYLTFFTLGVPLTAATATLHGLLATHGIAADPRLIAKQPQVFLAFLGAMMIAALLAAALAAGIATILPRLSRRGGFVPQIRPVVAVCLAAGAYAMNDRWLDVLVVATAGGIGFVLRRLEFELTPLLIGLVLGHGIEERMRDALVQTGGSIAGIAGRPVALGLLLSAVILVIIAAQARVARWRGQIFAE